MTPNSAATAVNDTDIPPDSPPRKRREVLGIAIVSLSALLGPALFSIHFGQGTLMGPLGSSLARAAYATLGVSSYLVAILLAIVGVRVLAEQPIVPRASDVAGYVTASLGMIVLCHFAGASARVAGVSPGGLAGEFLGEIMRAGLGTVGAGLLATTALLAGLVLAEEISVVALVRTAATRVKARRQRRIAAAPAEPLIVEPVRIDIAPPAPTTMTETTEDPAEPTQRMDGTPLQAMMEPAIIEPEYRTRAKPQLPARSHRAIIGFKLPDVALLNYEEQPLAEFDRQEMRDLAERLTTSLASYGVKGYVSEIHPGPVVTMYEFVPEPGTRLTKINQLSADLAMALKAARPVRIVAPLPGKGAVGIEVPNRRRERVLLRDVLTDDMFAKSPGRLPIALGKDIYGRPIAVDLQRMPHLLVAGTTGSGKSVSLNGMITSLLYHATPEQVRMILVDPKMVELSIYDGIPHLLLPVVTDPQKAALALRWAVDEMERRYRLIYEAKVRHLEAYNDKQTAVAEKLPYLVVVIDEFADLMTTAPKEVEWSVQRLAQKARAAGIHVILATQRPSVDVITAVIKANFPVRVAFYVKDAINSRVIIDQNGAETLLGDGDMLYQDKGLQLQRVHGAYVSEEELRRVVDSLKAQGAPDYNLDIVKPRDDESQEQEDIDDGAEADEFYVRAVQFVRQSRMASISRLQRELGVGYNRAAKMIERMEREGMVGPADGARPREVLAHPL